MKKLRFNTLLLAFSGAILISSSAFAQDTTVTTSTVTSDGIVQQFVPTSSEIVVTSSTTSAPTHYTYDKTTTFLDAAGNVVSQESIKQNTPARIYYTKVGDRLVVTKFIVNPTVETQVVTPVVPAVEETTTTTTTTEK